jgi:hypothetical protein
MAESKHGFFGATWGDVVARIGGTNFNVQDFASLRATVASGSSATVVQVDSTEGFAAGQKININTASFPEQGETRTIESVDSATQLTVATAFSSVPTAGAVAHDGPEQVEACMAAAEAEIESLLPARYRAMLSRVEGEVIVRRAASGQTAATLCQTALPFAAAPSGVKLYRNYRGDWADRQESDEMAAGEFSVDGRTVTFAAGLSEGDRVVAEYAHGLDVAPPLLTDLLVDLAACAAAERAHLDLGSPEAAWLTAVVKRALGRLEGLAATGDGPPRGIPEFDDIPLYNDWRREPARGVASGNVHLA